MRFLKSMKGVLKDQNGVETLFSRPQTDGSRWMLWETFEAEGVSACRVSAACSEGFDGFRSMCLIPDGADARVDYLAIVNHSPFWCSPAFGDVLCELPHEDKPVQALLLRREEGWEYYLPVCDDTYKTVIFGREGGLEFCIYNNCAGLTECRDQLAFVCASGDDPFELMRRCAKAAAVLLDNGLRMREERRYPEMLEYLGWCSWDALQIRVNHEGLLEKAREFAEKGVPVGFAIIDDMWADCPHLEDVPHEIDFHSMMVEMHKSSMRSFDGSPKRFPKGMKAAVADLKAAGIPHVGIWFPTTGYWNAFAPDGEAREWGDLLTQDRKGRLVPNPVPEKVFGLYDLFCSRIRSWGCDFVKVDNQSFHGYYRGIKPIGQTARALQIGIDSAVGSNFDGALINCMGMSSECMFNRRSSAVSRCSDDFMPESREWFAKNILQCAYNGLLQGQYYVNDWDMWWTDDEQAMKNSLCRAVSGGPIYVSDKLGRTNAEVLKPLVLSDGRILRPDDSATPTLDCLIGNPTESGRIFKIRNRVGKSGLAAVFNIDAQNRAVSGSLAPTETGVAEGDYAYYEHFTGEAGVLHAGEKLEITLENNDVFRLYTFVPYQKGVPAVIGLLDQYIGIKAVTEVTDRFVTLREGGRIGFVSETPLAVEADGKPLAVERCGVLQTVTVDREITRLYFS
ncbi:MAG: hypothetical protein IKJ35_01960 [Clostridia bacterium]|nr:hypothetical protein [Clostridia bacterium]